MATLSAKKITEALKKAQNVGHTEEAFTIGGCEIVLRSLTSDEYIVVMSEIEEVPEAGYVKAFKQEHLARSIIEVNGIDLRTIDFVTVDVEDLDPQTRKTVIKEVKVERHAFIRDYVISNWAREALDVAFRKFNDVVTVAERKASEGVTFLTPDETGEERYRRLLLEAKAIEGSVSIDLVNRIREEVGFVGGEAKATPEEYKAAGDRLAALEPEPEEEVFTKDPEPPPLPSEPTPRRPPPRMVVEAPTQQAQAVQAPEASPDPDELMTRRQPLNQRVVAVPQPVTPPQALHVNPVIPASPAALKRAAEIAALEGDFSAEPEPAIQGGTEVAELTRVQPKLDPAALAPIFDQPPTLGLNPRFRPPQR